MMVKVAMAWARMRAFCLALRCAKISDVSCSRKDWVFVSKMDWRRRWRILRQLRSTSVQMSRLKMAETLRRVLKRASRGQSSLGMVTWPSSMAKTSMAALTAAFIC